MGDGGPVGQEQRLAALLPGGIESATRRRLLADVTTDDELEARVRSAWQDGSLHHDDDLWWMAPPGPIDTGGPSVRARASGVIDLMATMRRRCDEGRPDDALQLAFATTADLVASLGSDPHREADLAELAITTVFALLDAGRVHPALAIAQGGHHESILRDEPRSQGWFAAALGVAELLAGRILHARRLQTEARLLGRLTGDDDLVALSSGVRAVTFSMVGERPPDVVAPLLAAPTVTMGLGDRENIVRADAWRNADRAHLRALASVARDAKDAGRFGRAAGLAGELAVLGDPAAAVAIFDDDFGELDGDLLPLWPRIAGALATRDSGELATVAAVLDRQGIMGLAAAFTLQAASIEQDRDDEAMRQLLREANRRADGLEMGAQYLAQFRRLLPLRTREREIAELAASGLSNKEIATQLVLSIRTVENHLYRVYDKLGIEGREDLGALLSATVSGRPG